jgi:hypothetical protein
MRPGFHGQGLELQHLTADDRAKWVRAATFGPFCAGLLMAAAAGAYDFSQPPPGLRVDAINTFQLYVADQETFDDNLFRIPPNVPGVPGAAFANPSRSDSANTSTLGGQGKWAIGRQDVEIDVRADENRFAHNDALNFVSSNAVGTLNWRIGPYLSGQVQTFYDRSLASFSQTRFSGKDLLTSLEELGYARYQLGPHWAAYGQIRGSYTDHSAPEQVFNNFHNRAGFAGVEYATNVDDTFGFEYQYVDITFNNGGALNAGAYDYDEDTEKFLVKYAITEKTNISGYAGALQRKYPGLPINSYSGGIWRGNLGWNPTEKTNLILSGWHELHAYIDQESNYFVAKGVSLAPGWNPTDKIQLSVMATYEKQDYIGASSSVVTTGERADKVSSAQATLRYSPRDAWILTAFVRHEKRESNQLQFSFDDNLVSGSVTFRFW